MKRDTSSDLDVLNLRMRRFFEPHFVAIASASHPLRDVHVFADSGHHPRLWRVDIEAPGEVGARRRIGQMVVFQSQRGSVRIVGIHFFFLLL